jgi:hypothetical protein
VKGDGDYKSRMKTLLVNPAVLSYAEYLKKRLQEGCRNAALLYREIKAQGYRGGSATVRRLLRSWKYQLPARYQRLESLPDFDAPAPRQAVWWLLKPGELEPNQKEYVREAQRLSLKSVPV